MARIAKSLETLRSQINAKYPGRSKASDGWIGDAAHQAVASDHNPNRHGVVTALDLTNHPKSGFDAHALADTLITKRHPELKYVISNKRIAGDWTGWRWTAYHGSNPHTNHIHVSVGVGDDGRSEPPYDSTQEWDISSTVISVPVQPAPPVSTQTGTVHLPAHAQSWALYRVNSGYRKGTSDQIATLAPAQFGGLTYKIVENRGNVVVIDTEMFGRGAIWVQGTDAIISGGAQQPPQSTAPAKSTVHFPAHATSWRVYKVGSGYRPNTSDQVGILRPNLFGGLTYPIVQNNGNTVVIDTQNFGRVAAWVQGTDAIIR